MALTKTAEVPHPTRREVWDANNAGSKAEAAFLLMNARIKVLRPKLQC